MNQLSRIELAFAAGAIALGIYILVGSSGINLGTGYDHIGPRFFPYLIAAGLLVSAGAMVFEVLGRTIHAQTIAIDIVAFFFLVLGLVLCVLLLERLGFILAVTVLFTLAARAFKSRHLIRDGLMGLGLAITVYYIFTFGLGLVLPRGVLSGLI